MNLLKTILAGLFTCIIVAVVSIFSYGLDVPENWKVPPSYGGGDGIWMLNLLDSVAAGEFKPLHPFIRQELGAPYVANFNDWPSGISIELLPGGWLINYFGLAAGPNLYLILCHVAAGLSMFLCLKFMRCQTQWAFVFGIAFGLCPFLFKRNFGHGTLVNISYLVPIICSSAWYLFKNSPLKIQQKGWISLFAFSGFIGSQWPYYSTPYLWILAGAGMFWAVNLRSVRILIAYGLGFAGFVAGFLFSYSPTLLQTLEEGKNFQAVHRAYQSLQVLALRPIEMFLPGSASGIPILEQLSSFYENQCVFRKNFEFSESMSAYLGLVACIGLLLLIGTTAYFILSKQQVKISGWFWFSLFLIAFSIVGGLNGFLGLAKFYFLQSANRYSIYITAISLIYFSGFLSRPPIFLRRWSLRGVAVLLFILACAEPVLPRLQGANLDAPGKAKFESDKQFAFHLKNRLSSGAMLFNFPVIELPERGTYTIFRPMFHTENIRYSFGAIAGRARDTWQLDMSMLPTNDMVNKLKNYGFSGVLVYRGEYLSHEEKAAADRVSAFLKENSFPSIVSSFGDFEFFGFDPNPDPVFPPVRPMFLNKWWEKEIQPSGFVKSLSENGSNWRWSTHSSALVEIFNEQTETRRLTLRGRALGNQIADLKIFVKEKMVFFGKISADLPIEFSTDSLEVPGHKAVRFEFKQDHKPVLREGRKFSFAVSDLEATWE